MYWSHLGGLADYTRLQDEGGGRVALTSNGRWEVYTIYCGVGDAESSRRWVKASAISNARFQHKKLATFNKYVEGTVLTTAMLYSE